jgi:hypothetical protein
MTHQSQASLADFQMLTWYLPKLYKNSRYWGQSRLNWFEGTFLKCVGICFAVSRSTEHGIMCTFGAQRSSVCFSRKCYITPKATKSLNEGLSPSQGNWISQRMVFYNDLAHNWAFPQKVKKLKSKKERERKKSLGYRKKGKKTNKIKDAYYEE